ncbi:ferredoxin family 2Fe-2S iron-sulfur cluster binding protein [Aspergillus saccharolyticus JOP 1030-1]|uniref:2Fe-2S iron-sulfur cluster binding domain protein n=1 Tax=Aspergillus saccharolyticus JOP 1030-1 TaxID=1450539 RepID=A0A319A5S7_9EURO|nr:2Fe-2S iron-sulfur cluster binding domain protein [Aspergillus saccharolyticus JOP 1030-1]PYH42752.1 2Fe-2S iron-sulfur cluster binding domain protein [Aspergillus saccharolyticus JOP 1030-1]
MSFWREAGLNLRHVLPRAGESLGRAPSSLSLASRFPVKSSRSMSSGRASLSVRRSWGTPRIQYQGVFGRRSFSVSAGAQHGHITPPKPGEEINISFIDKDGAKYDFQVSEGDNLLDIAQANDLEMEGACGGSCACSTCHVIVEDSDMFDKMEEPSDDENDMLDLAFGLTETSRLGCQVVMTKELDGLVVRLPSMTRNLQASDFEPKH